MGTKKFWCEFIDLYRELPALWCIKSPDYSNRVLKAHGYEQLIDKLKEIYPDADREMAIKKINNFRTAYRKALNKVKESKKSGADDLRVYKPSLWYYNKLSFLEDENQYIPTKSTVENRNKHHMRPRLRHIEEKDTEDDKLISLPCEQPQTNRHANSDTELLAKTWALQYDEVQSGQKFMVRKIISDILFHGCLGTLEIDHVVDIQQLLLKRSATPDDPLDVEEEEEEMHHEYKK